MTKILLTRHGHVEGIKPIRFRGRQPLDLTARGRAEAEAVAQRIAGAFRPSHIYTSPMGRCVATAAAIAKACGIAAKTCDDLNDLDFGAWQFKTFPEAKALNPALFAAWFAAPHLVRFPNGESLQDLAGRVANAVRMVLARHPDETIVLVGHDSVNCTLLLQFLDLPLSAYWRIAQVPCCLNEIDIAGDKVCVRRINENDYLDAIAAEYNDDALTANSLT
jgi:broad specificity phosphatase PhoE